jgi:pimeloyl-ACP methyl ester carboxylesterase
MPSAKANGLEIAYEDAGPADAPVILLVMGLGAQLVFWPDALVAGLVERGFRVVRFDNRDVGLSTHLRHHKPPSRLRLAAGLLGLPVAMPYTLRDMARDTVGLLDALGIARAHVVGASMGGMIAQNLAADHAGRVLSLTSIMSTSGRRGLPGPTPELRRMMFQRRPVGSRDAAIDMGSRMLAAFAAPGPIHDEAERRAAVAVAYDRGFDPDGTARQFGAIVADGSRIERLKRIRVPTLVIHGRGDPLVPLPAGVDTAAHIRGARLEIIEGMGHDLPSAAIPRLVDLIASHAASA